MTLRQQLQLKRALRRLRTWAPPISIGVIVGAGFFMLADHLDPADAATNQQVAPVQSHARRGHTTGATQTHQPARQVSAYSGRGQVAASAPYRNCSDARANGASSIQRGEPGYSGHLDRDKDGVACEPYPR